MTELSAALGEAIDAGQVGDRLWLYSTYHCNLACKYCLTESSPRIANRRTLDRGEMVAAVEQARELGIRRVGITGGEPFMLSGFPELLAEIGEMLPTLALTNATLFNERIVERIAPLAEADVALQISLDSDQPTRNDEFRGPDNYAKVLDAIPRLLDRGIRVRIATTVQDQTPDELHRLCVLHRGLGISDDDHVVRSVVRRGRADTEDMGLELGPTDVLPELTLTADGAFMHPFAPTVRHGRTDLDLLVSRRILPLEHPMRRFLAAAAGLRSGGDVVRNFR